MCPGNRWHLAVKKNHQDHSSVNDDDDVVGIIMANNMPLYYHMQHTAC